MVLWAALLAACETGTRCTTNADCPNGECEPSIGVCVLRADGGTGGGSAGGGPGGGGGGGGTAGSGGSGGVGGGTQAIIPPTITLPLPPTRTTVGMHTEADPQAPTAWKRDESVNVRLDVTGLSRVVLELGADGGSWVDAGNITGTGCNCGGPTCRCLAAYLWLRPMPSDRDTFYVRAFVELVDGGRGYSNVEAIDVTRYAFRNIMVPDALTPAFAPTGDLVAANHAGAVARFSQTGVPGWTFTGTNIAQPPVIAPHSDDAGVVHVIRNIAGSMSAPESRYVLDGGILSGCTAQPGVSNGMPTVALSRTMNQTAPVFVFARGQNLVTAHRPTAPMDKCELVSGDNIADNASVAGLAAHDEVVIALDRNVSNFRINSRRFGMMGAEAIVRSQFVTDGGFSPDDISVGFDDSFSYVELTDATRTVRALHQRPNNGLTVTDIIPRVVSNIGQRDSQGTYLEVNGTVLSLDKNGGNTALGNSGIYGNRGWIILTAGEGTVVVTDFGWVILLDGDENIVSRWKLEGVSTVTRGPNLDCNRRGASKPGRPGLLVVPATSALLGYIIDAPGVNTEAEMAMEYANPRNTVSNIWPGSSFACP